MPHGEQHAPAGGAHRGLRVLLVEDDDANQEVETLMLEHLGHVVDVVADGAAAVTAAAARAYDAILMDCHLPHMDGYATAAAIRQAEGSQGHVPIIGLTVRDDRARCVEAGMDDHLAKPFALADLEGALARAAPPASDTFAGVLDPATVDQLRMLASSGSSDLLHKLQASFARDAPERFGALREAVASGDIGAAAFNVHTLKGSAANLGAIQVVATCRALEDAAETGDAARTRELVDRLAPEIASAQSALARLAESG